MLSSATARCWVINISDGRQGRLGFGLKFALSRIYAIFGWALISACVGMLLNALKRNRKVGCFVVSLLGSAWTALTYFVIPVIMAEGLGSVAAVKSSMSTLNKECCTALMGNFSLGMFGFLLMLPLIGIGILLGTMVSVPVAIAVASATRHPGRPRECHRRRHLQGLKFFAWQIIIDTFSDRVDAVLLWENEG